VRYSELKLSTTGSRVHYDWAIDDCLSPGNANALMNVARLVGCALSAAKVSGCYETRNSAVVGETQILHHLSTCDDYEANAEQRGRIGSEFPYFLRIQQRQVESIIFGYPTYKHNYSKASGWPVRDRLWDYTRCL
jgi:hypothetical protein